MLHASATEVSCVTRWLLRRCWLLSVAGSSLMRRGGGRGLPKELSRHPNESSCRAASTPPVRGVSGEPCIRAWARGFKSDWSTRFGMGHRPLAAFDGGLALIHDQLLVN